MTKDLHSNRPILVTGGAGFIGSAFVRRLVGAGRSVAVLDALTYAGRMENLISVENIDGYSFHQGDICDVKAVTDIMEAVKPGTIVHFAAESHVDRSIENPRQFLETNILGTQVMLDAALAAGIRFVHVSTDEVFGSLGDKGAFTETTPYDPRSPYSASKAASDHLVRAWGETYGMDAVIVNCTNNYGPYQFPEKLIPHMILSALAGRPLPVYGTGSNVRDWLYVDDHVEAIELAMDKGKSGQTYCIGGEAEYSNLEVVKAIAATLDQLAPREDGQRHETAIEYVMDRPGHDFRYAMDITRIRSELGWSPSHTFEEGLEKTISWYLENRNWWQAILDAGEGSQRIGLEKKESAK